MAWRDAKDLHDADYISQNERSIAGQLMEAWNRIQKVEGEISYLRKQFMQHISTFHPSCKGALRHD